MKKVLSAMADARVGEWEQQLNGLSLVEKLAALKDLYLSNDGFMDVDYHRETETYNWIRNDFHSSCH